jgi:hypothetical protein
MNLEQDLSDALHGAFGAALPSPDLRARVMAATRRESAGSRRAPRRLLLATCGLTAALLLAAVVSTVVKPNVTASQEPSATASGPLTHYAVGLLSFDYPSSWKSRVNVLPWVLGLWTGSDPADCLTPTPQPTGPDSHCGRQVPLVPGTLYVTVGDYTASPPELPIDPSQPSALPPGGQYVTVAGLPAILVAGATATGQTLDWTISEPNEPRTRLQIHAEFADPGAAEMRTEIMALVASLKFYNPAKPLDLSQGNDIAGRWMSSMHTIPGLECFSTTPGEVATGAVTDFPWSDGVLQKNSLQVTRLSKPLPVSCRMTVEPATSVGLWKVTLTEWWTADVDRTAGSYTLVFWIDPDATGDAFDEGVGWGPDVSGGPFPYVSEDQFPSST